MATITSYVTQGVQDGQPVLFKIHELFWRTIGHGTAKTVSDFKLTIEGRVELPIYKGDLQIQGSLLDRDEAATAGSCRLGLNTLSDSSASYSTHGDAMTIAAVLGGEEVQIRLSPLRQDNVTECKISGPLNLTIYIEPTAAT